MKTLSLNMTCKVLDKTITNLETELTASREAHESIMHDSPMSRNMKNVGGKWANALFAQKFQRFASFPKLIREIPLF